MTSSTMMFTPSRKVSSFIDFGRKCDYCNDFIVMGRLVAHEVYAFAEGVLLSTFMEKVRFNF